MKWLLALAVGLSASFVHAEEVTEGAGAVLRVLDKQNGDVHDETLTSGSYVSIGRLQLELSECRYPTGNPSGDAYAFLTLRDDDTSVVFSGWMIASSPALSALDDPRYDVWVVRCTTS